MNTSAASTETKPTEVICKGDTTTGVSGLVGTQVHLTSPWGAVPWAALPVHLCPHPPWFQQRGRFCRPPQDPLAGGGGALPQASRGVLGTPTPHSAARFAAPDTSEAGPALHSRARWETTTVHPATWSRRGAGLVRRRPTDVAPHLRSVPARGFPPAAEGPANWISPGRPRLHLDG